ncbi:MAG: tetratricopeptide repeat protein [Candidatus Hodarchaeota archaeon]
MNNEIDFKEYTESIESLFSPKSSYTFLVGAGISMDPPTSMPSAWEIVRGLLELFAPSEEIDNLLSLNMLRFELVVEKIQNEFDENLRFLDYLEYVTEPNLIHLFLANTITRGNYVVTTNFDYMIERALLQVLDKQWHEEIVPVITREDFIFYQEPENLIKSGKYPLYKIHGSKHNIITGTNTQESLITTISALGKGREEGETFAIEPYKKSTVYNLMNDRTLVVMGYSGSDDFDIGPTLRELPFLNRIIWIEHYQGNGFEISKIRPDEISKSQLGSSQLHDLLRDISSTGNFEVILIRANTQNFIKENLWEIFLPYTPINRVDLDKTEKNVPKFSEWIKSLFQDISLVKKYRLATQLFYSLKDIEATKRCSEKGLSFSDETNNLASKSYFLNFLGMISQITGNYDNAIKCYEEALQIDEILKDDSSKSTDLNNIGSVYLTLGKYDEAIENYSGALEIANNLGDLSGKATCKNNIGRVLEIRGELDPALENYKEALAIYEELGNLNNKAAMLNNIGMIYAARKEYGLAAKNYEEALKIADLLGDLYGKIILLNNIGRVNDENENYTNALLKYNEAVSISEQLGDLSKKAGCLNNIGSVYLAQGQPRKALEKYKEALNIEERLGDPLMKAIYINNIAMIYENLKEYDLALKYYLEALNIFKEIGDLSKRALMLTKTASIDIIKDDYESALDKYQEAVLIYGELKDLSNKAACLSNIGKIFEKFEDYNKALEIYEETFQIDEQLGDLIGKANDFFNIARIYELCGEYRRSLNKFEESKEIFNHLNQQQYSDAVQQKIDEIKRKIGK